MTHDLGHLTFSTPDPVNMTFQHRDLGHVTLCQGDPYSSPHDLGSEKEDIRQASVQAMVSDVSP